MRPTTITASIIALLITTIPVATLNGISIEPPRCTNRCTVDSMFATQCQDISCLCHEEHYQKSLFQCLYSQCDAPDYGPALIHSMRTCVVSGADIHLAAAVEVDQSLLHAREVEYLAGRELPELPGLQLRQESAGGQGLRPTATVWVTTTTTVTAGGITVTPFAGGNNVGSSNAGSGQMGPGLGLTVTLTITVTVTTTLPGGALPQISVANLGSHDSDVGGGPIMSSLDANGTAAPTRPWLVTVSEANKRQRPSHMGLLLWAGSMLALDLYVNVF